MASGQHQLMPHRWRRSHVELPVDDLIPIAVIGKRPEVVVSFREERPGSSESPYHDLTSCPSGFQDVGCAASIGVTSVPIPSISIETTSPGFRNSGGFRPALTPSGVPVA